jgi:hypothetical protein
MQRRLTEMISFKEFVLEIPKTIPEVNSKYIDLKLTKEIQKAIKEDSFFKITDEVIQIPLSLTESIYCLVLHNVIQGAVRTKYLQIQETYVEIYLSKKYKKDFKGFLSKILPIISKEEHKNVISGDEFTGDSVAAWLSIMKNVNFYVINTKTKERIYVDDFVKNQTFGKYDKFKDKRIVIEF